MPSQPSLGSPCHLLQSLVQGPAVSLGPKLGGGATCPLSTLITQRCPLSQFTWSLEVRGGSRFGNSSVPLPLPSTKARTLVPGLHPEHHSVFHSSHHQLRRGHCWTHPYHSQDPPSARSAASCSASVVCPIGHPLLPIPWEYLAPSYPEG